MKTRSSLAIACLALVAPAVYGDYSTVILEDEPAAYYRFEEEAGATTVTDSSDNTLDTTDIVNAVFGGAGAIGSAVQFDGDGSILTPLTLNPASRDFTLEAIVNPNMIAAAGGVFLSNQDGGIGPGRSNLLVNGDYNINSFIGGATTSAGPIAEDGIWYHIILTYDSSAVGGVDPTLRFYIDGVEQSSSFQVAESADGGWVIGSHKSRNSQFFSGLVDELAIYAFRLDDPDGDGDTADSRVGAHFAAYEAAGVIKSFTSDATSIGNGESATLSWEVADPATVLTLDDGSGPVDVLGGLVDEMGSMVVSPTENTTYTLSATGGVLDCSEVAEITILVNAVPVIESFTASAMEIVEGAEVDFSWTVTDADTVTIDNGVGAVDAMSGTESVVVGSTATYTLTATNANGSSTAEVMINATPMGLVAHWRVGEAPDEQAGTILVAEQGAAFDGTFSGTPAFDATDPAPVPGGSTASIIFDGLNSFVDVLDYGGIGGSQARTVAFWFKGPAVQTNDNGTLIGWGTGATGMRYDMRLKNNPSGFVRTEVSGSGSDGTAIIADDTWHHCAIVLDPAVGTNIGDILFYVDGQLDTLSAAGTTEVNSSTINNVRIGASRATANRSLTGKMDDIRIYNHALIPAEVLALVESQAEFTITKIELLPGGDVELTWSGAPGDYAVDYSFDLKGIWQELNDNANIPQGSDTGTMVDDFIAPDAANTRVFYRVRVPD